ncbi:MAG: NAD(P)/FAD-dependent oxidoreductase [Pseudomonadota bacterium]
MTVQIDLLIIGAGPAGMSAAITARKHGLTVLVVDEQFEPGGQIWRNIETNSRINRSKILGSSYLEGKETVKRFRDCGAAYRPRTRVWQVEAGCKAYMSTDGVASQVKAKCMLLATGAQERPTPFPGWTLPGVMTVGAGQILLKTSYQVPKGRVWIAGNGPLSLLYAVQLLDVGGKIAGFLDTTPRQSPFKLLSSFVKAAIHAPLDLFKGLGWLLKLRRHVKFIRNVSDVEAIGDDKIQHLRYKTGSGLEDTVPADVLFVHEGIVPTIHPTLSLGCDHHWIGDQGSFAPTLNQWGETTKENIFVAGDGAGIGGARVACLRGELTALYIAHKTRHMSMAELQVQAKPVRSRLKNAMASRPFLDKLYFPRSEIFNPDGRALACRCEEVSVETVRDQANLQVFDPNKLKALTRAGMGPCQGRQCGYVIANLLAGSASCKPADIGLNRVRPPLKPLTLDELATLAEPEARP